MVRIRTEVEEFFFSSKSVFAYMNLSLRQGGRKKEDRGETTLQDGEYLHLCNFLPVPALMIGASSEVSRYCTRICFTSWGGSVYHIILYPHVKFKPAAVVRHLQAMIPRDACSLRLHALPMHYAWLL